MVSVDSRRVSRAPRYSGVRLDRKSTRLNSSHLVISYAVFCLKKKKKQCDVFYALHNLLLMLRERSVHLVVPFAPLTTNGVQTDLSLLCPRTSISHTLYMHTTC